VATDAITSWSCDPTVNGFTTTSDYVLGPGGEQMTEMDMGASNVMAWQHTNVWAGGKLFGTYDKDGLHFYFDDWLGTRRAQTDYAGVMEQTCASLPFGDSLNCTLSIQNPTEHHFTGKERDTESGNDYFEARYYSSVLGRFVSPDWSENEEPVPYAKLDDPQTLNLYAYVGNHPLGTVDEDGHNWLVSSAQGGPALDVTDQQMDTALTAHPDIKLRAGGNLEVDGTVVGHATYYNEKDTKAFGQIASDGFGAINFMLTNMVAEVATAGLGEIAGPFVGRGINALEKMRANWAMKAVVRVGREGQEAVRELEDIGIKRGFQVAGRRRIADGMTETTVNEVKNVVKQGWTKQLQDNAAFAKSTGRQFQLWLRQGAETTTPLRAAEKAGKVVIRRF